MRILIFALLIFVSCNKKETVIPPANHTIEFKCYSTCDSMRLDNSICCDNRFSISETIYGINTYTYSKVVQQGTTFLQEYNIEGADLGFPHSHTIKTQIFIDGSLVKESNDSIDAPCNILY